MGAAAEVLGCWPSWLPREGVAEGSPAAAVAAEAEAEVEGVRAACWQRVIMHMEEDDTPRGMALAAIACETRKEGGVRRDQ